MVFTSSTSSSSSSAPYSASTNASSSYSSLLSARSIPQGGATTATRKTASPTSLDDLLGLADDSRTLDKLGGDYGLDIDSRHTSSSATNAMRFLRELKHTYPEILAQNERLIMATGAEEDLRGRRLHPQKDVSSTWESSPPSSSSPSSFLDSRRKPAPPKPKMTQSGIQSAIARQSTSTANPANPSTLSNGSSIGGRDGAYGTTTTESRRRAIAPSSANVQQSSSLSPVSFSSISTSSDSSVASISSHPHSYHPTQAPAHAQAPVYHPQPQRPYEPSPALFQYEITNPGYVYPSSTSAVEADQLDGYGEDYEYEYDEVEEFDELRLIPESSSGFQPQSYGNGSAPYYVAPAYPTSFPNRVTPSSLSPVPIARSHITHNPNPNLPVRSNPLPPPGGGPVVPQGQTNRSTHIWQGAGASGGVRSDMTARMGTTSVPANSRRPYGQTNTGMAPPQGKASTTSSAGQYLF